MTSAARPGRVGLPGGRGQGVPHRRHHHDAWRRARRRPRRRGVPKGHDGRRRLDSPCETRSPENDDTRTGRWDRPWTLPFADGAAATGFSLDDLTLALLVGSLVLVVSVAAVRLSLRSGLPSLLIYLGIGLVLGEAGFGIRYDNQQLTQVLGYAALVLILVEGGLTTQWSGIRRSVAPAAVLATVGVAVSVLVVGRRGPRAARVVLADRLPRRRGARLDGCRGRLLRAAPRPAPPADLGDARGRVGLQRRARSCSSSPRSPPASLPGATPDPWWQIGVVAVARAGRRGRHRARDRVAAARGCCGSWRRRRRRCSRSGWSRWRCSRTPRPTRCTRRGSSPATSRRSCSATSGCPHRPAVMGFATAIGWLAQIGLFVLLGLLASPSGFVRRARCRPSSSGRRCCSSGDPLSVLVSCAPFGMSWRTQAFLSWAGLRGAVPVVLATVPGHAGHPRRGRGSSTSCSCSSSSSPSSRRRRCPGWPGGWASTRPTTGSTSPSRRPRSPTSAPSCSRSTSGRGRGSPACGCSSCACRWGPTSSLVVREGRSFVPRENDVLRHGDQLLVVAPERGAAGASRRRLHAVSRGGRLADWSDD